MPGQSAARDGNKVKPHATQCKRWVVGQIEFCSARDPQLLLHSHSLKSGLVTLAKLYFHETKHSPGRARNQINLANFRAPPPAQNSIALCQEEKAGEYLRPAPAALRRLA